MSEAIPFEITARREELRELCILRWKRPIAFLSGVPSTILRICAKILTSIESSFEFEKM